MKKFLIFIIAFALVLSCNKDVKKEILNQSQLTVTSTDSTANTLFITRPLDGILFWESKVDTVFKNEIEEFDFKFSVEKPLYANLRLGNNFNKLILLPNQDYKIDFNGKTVTFSGDNGKGQELYNSFMRPPVNSFTFINKFDNDSTTTQLEDKISSMKTAEIKNVEALYSSKEIDEDFYVMLTNDINYYYASGVVSLSDYRATKSKLDEEKESYKSLIEKTKIAYPYTTDFEGLSWFDYVLNLEVISNNFGGLSNEKINSLYKKDSLQYLITNRIINNVEKPYVEKLLAFYLFNEFKQKQYQKSLVSIFDDFEMTYPESHFIPYLKKEADNFREYHEKAKSKLPNDVTLVENENINDLTTLLKEFKGQKLYIDMWATWCGPCKREFEYNEKISEILKDNNYKKLYISIDKKDKKDKWLEMIKYYDLAGYHHLANEAFFIDFEKNYSTMEGMVAIPQYLIINEKGKIITNSAPRPSQFNELNSLLTSELN